LAQATPRRLGEKKTGSKMLDLVAAVVGDAPPRSIYGLTETLDRILKHAPQLAAVRKFQRLVSVASTH
jgi:hypothetical protein